MNSLVILVIAFVSSQPMTALPLKKIVFPSSSEEIDEIYSYSDEISPYMSKGVPQKYDDTNNTNKLQFHIDAASVPCANSTVHFCENVGQQLYPLQYVESMIQRNGDRYAELIERNNVKLRDDFPEPKGLCDTYKRVVYPEIAKNVHLDWRFVLNTHDIRQQIRIELCQKKSCQCQHSDSFRNGMEATFRCMQKFAKINLLTLDNNGKIFSDRFEFPSHCECMMYENKPTNSRVRRKN